MGAILVTGATGFIGAHVVRQLRLLGEPVRVLVRDPGRLEAVGLAEAPGLAVARGDLLDAASLDRALDGCDRVLHVAGTVSTDRRAREELHRANHDATVGLFGACVRARGVRKVVYLASIFALGGGEPVAVREDASWPHALLRVDYVEAKRNAELAAYRFRDAGLPLVMAYPCFCYGPGDVYDSSSRLVQEVLRGRLPAVLRGGQNAMDVRDAAGGLVAALDRGRVGEKYLLGGVNRSNRELVALIARLGGLRPPRVTVGRRASLALGRALERWHPAPPLDEQSAALATRWWWYDDRKARRELGHTSRPLEQTLRDAIRWQREAGRAPWPPAPRDA